MLNPDSQSLVPGERTRVGCRSSVEDPGFERSAWRDQVFRKKPERCKTPLLGGIHRGKVGNTVRTSFPVSTQCNEELLTGALGKAGGCHHHLGLRALTAPSRSLGRHQAPSLLIRKAQREIQSLGIPQRSPGLALFQEGTDSFCNYRKSSSVC